MTIHSYGKRDYAFGQAVVTLRAAMHLTQVELARFLGVSRAAVLGWEAGSSYPKVANLKRFIALGVQRGAFAGRLDEEIRTLWQTAHQKMLMDEPWLATLLGQRPTQRPHIVSGLGEGARLHYLPGARRVPEQRVDWEDALDVPNFYGRQLELAILEQWIVQERFDILPVEVDGEQLYGCFGPYVVDGKFAGLYNRFARDGFIAFNALVGAVVGA